MNGLGIAEIIVILFIGVIFILPFWKIFTKAGFPGWLSLLLVLPIANIIILFYIAFAEWPALKK